MRQTFTDGSVRYVPDVCPCCTLNTGGQHEAKCPMRNVEIIQTVRFCDKAEWQR